MSLRRLRGFESLPLRHLTANFTGVIALPNTNINILLVDDHQVVRSGIKRILDNIDGLQVVGEASDGEEALQLAREISPHIILMDLSMPKVDGVEAAKRLHRACPDIRILILTSLTDEPIPSKVLQIAGVNGFLTKKLNIWTQSAPSVSRNVSPCPTWCENEAGQSPAVIDGIRRTGHLVAEFPRSLSAFAVRHQSRSGLRL